MKIFKKIFLAILIVGFMLGLSGPIVTLAVNPTANTFDSNTVTIPTSRVQTPAVPAISAIPAVLTTSPAIPAIPALSASPIAYIERITPTSSPVGAIVEIKGDNLKGFEGDIYFYFERADGRRVKLPGIISTQNTNDLSGLQTVKVTLKEPCQLGQTIIGDYSGISSLCDYVALTPGTYKVYTEPWGKRSNIVDFTITASVIPTPIYNTSVISTLTETENPTLTTNFGQEVRTIAVNLGKGHKNINVKTLQEFLISQNIGSASKNLSRVGATSYFGILTRAALAEFQAKVGIKPAWGNFGPITRAYINVNY